MPAAALSIGQLSARTGCKVPTIRYYEEIELLGEAPRTDGGHRVYGEEDVQRLTFIRKSRDLGFSLDAVRSLLDLAQNRERSCAEVDTIASEHLDEVGEKLRHLAAMRDALQDLLEQCRHTTITECRIIDALSPAAVPGIESPSPAKLSTG
jgi:Cu(I)-responsive transcriptional regulator